LDVQKSKDEVEYEKKGSNGSSSDVKQFTTVNELSVAQSPSPPLPLARKISSQTASNIASYVEPTAADEVDRLLCAAREKGSTISGEMFSALGERDSASADV
jgi:hypothetical protein